MLNFVATRDHRYTFDKLARYDGMPEYRIWSYERVLRRRSLPHGTWIFTDLDRLDFWELELATHVFNALAATGSTVLNNPGHVGDRYSLLRRLHANGLNEFTAYPALGGERPSRFPVFLRTNRAHRGTVTDLLQTPEELQEALDTVTGQGYPLREILIIEYCAEESSPGIFSKFAAYRCGPRMVETLGVQQRHWCARLGEDGVAPEAIYDQEYQRIRTQPHTDLLSRACQLASIDFGRVDYSVVNGKVQIYEINTNPAFQAVESHPYPIRLKSDETCRTRLVEALHAIDSPARRPPCRLDDPVLKIQRYRDRPVVRPAWRP